jgi:hypothetical protein
LLLRAQGKLPPTVRLNQFRIYPPDYELLFRL